MRRVAVNLVNGVRPSLRIAAALVLAASLAALLLRPAPLSFEDRLRRFLRDEGIAGAVVAHGRIGARPEILVLGLAAPGRPMRAGDRFRLASLSKPITSAAVLRLVREGRTRLDDPVPEAGPGITVRHLLQHSGGWDWKRTVDPIGDPDTLPRIGLTDARSCEEVANRLPPVQFRPGTRYAYSNLGYCRLGHFVERVAGMPYQDYARRAVLAPRGAELAFMGEPTVRHPTHWRPAAFRALGVGGGWVGSAGDYWRFAAGPLDPLATSRPPYAVPGEHHYGLGWRVWPDGELTHFGAIPGAFSMVVRRGDRVAVLLFNGRPRDAEAGFRRLREALGSLDGF